MEKDFKVLSIDGGGIRGVFPAECLRLMEKTYQIDLYETFDMLAGTSTGAIIAAAIAAKKSASDIVQLYIDHGSPIFSKKRISLLNVIFRSQYEKTYLRDLLNEFFKNEKLGDITKPLILPATNIGTGIVHIFKSKYSSDFSRDLEVSLAEAVLTSCSAPMYFDPTCVSNFLLADGGLWANNPALIAMIDSIKHCNCPKEKLFILSLGTGIRKNAYGVDKKKKLWGFLTGWKRREFIELLLSLQSQSAQNYLKNLVEKDQLLRIDYVQQDVISLDDCTKIDTLLAYAGEEFSKNSKRIRKEFDLLEDRSVY